MFLSMKIYVLEFFETLIVGSISESIFRTGFYFSYCYDNLWKLDCQYLKIFSFAVTKVGFFLKYTVVQTCLGVYVLVCWVRGLVILMQVPKRKIKNQNNKNIRKEHYLSMNTFYFLKLHSFLCCQRICYYVCFLLIFFLMFHNISSHKNFSVLFTIELSLASLVG